MVLNASENSEGSCLRMWMSDTSQSESALNLGFIDQNPNLIRHFTVFRAPLGVDMTAEVKAAAIRLRSFKIKIS